ncbi:conserved hypothetical protein [Cyanobium sp. PCC 7001]|jgi:hypothetical protein|uniref:hypothetical protein n=1 Tax=unclassified Cyanobium TaxID=2627006 RepID=UPI0001805BC3|nr:MULTISPECIES: hypothetical protein [unclassified Cyanobium]EDY37204.1 conserved hypothetical protein [Cyanobium sp. PCC 7001]SBO42071.1 conserved protein of unknown function [Cyanobium sp. NIES-981]
MADHEGQQLSPRAMVRAHAYPVLAAIASLSLVAIAVLQIPSAVRDHRYNRCVDAQIQLRRAANLTGQEGPGKLLYLRAVEHCEGR